MTFIPERAVMFEKDDITAPMMKEEHPNIYQIVFNNPGVRKTQRRGKLVQIDYKPISGEILNVRDAEKDPKPEGK